jgi:hypothetical protein
MPPAARPWTWTLGLFAAAVGVGAVVFAALNLGGRAVSLLSVDVWLLLLTVGVTLGVVLDSRRHPAPPPQPIAPPR